MALSFYQPSSLSIQALLGQTESSPQLDCIIANYPFLGNSLDVSGNTFHGTSAAPGLVQDRFGNPSSAYQFDGVLDHIYFNSDSPIIRTQTFTITSWANLHGQGGGLNQINPIFVQRHDFAPPYSSNSLIALFAEYKGDTTSW